MIQHARFTFEPYQHINLQVRMWNMIYGLCDIHENSVLTLQVEKEVRTV
jgi:hypothetical protein